MHVERKGYFRRALLMCEKAGAFQSNLLREHCGRQGVIGSDGAKCCDALRTTVQRAPEDVFQFANFVPAVVRTADVISLNGNASRSMWRIEFRMLDGRGQRGQLQLFQVLAQCWKRR